MNPFSFLLALLGSGLMAFSTSGTRNSQGMVSNDEVTPIQSVDDPEPPAGSDTDDGEPVPQEDDDDSTEDTQNGTLPPTQTDSDPEPQPEPPTDVTAPVAPEQTGGIGTDGGATSALEIDGRVTVMEGRVATLDPDMADVESIRIVSDVPHGNVSVNPDNTFALVLTESDFTGHMSFQYEATYADGSTSMHTTQLNVVEGLQEQGWGTGETHYMLATDENDKVIVEHGENHTKVYISGDNSALSLADIARAENLSVSDVTGDFLANSEYGQSEDLALDSEAGMALWGTVTDRGSVTSNWLLFERGYEYDNLGRILDRDTNGESELNPLYLGAYGEGDKPEIKSELYQFQESSDNLVIQDLHFSGRVFVTYANNVLLDNVTVTDDQSSFINSSGITVRNSEFYDIYTSTDESEDFSGHSGRIQGIFINKTDGALLEGNLFDYIAWREGYEDGDVQPPTMWSQNMYLAETMTDVTVRDTISMRAASFGAQVRSGGFIEDNVFIDNNAGLNFVGSDYKGSGPLGQYTLATDNIVTSAAYKEADNIGTRSLGIRDGAELSSIVDNIVTHLANPDDPSELDYKLAARPALESEKDVYYDDTIVHNWAGATTDPDAHQRGTDDLDEDVLDQTTIQRFASQLLDKEDATIEDLAEYLRAEAENGSLTTLPDNELIKQFFQTGFGIAADFREEAADLRFIPDDLGEGVRWDNRLNWDSDDLPGLYAADTVDLGGNHVYHGANTRIDTLDFGDDGELTLYGGKLTLDGGIVGDEGGTLNIEGAGQLWSEGSDADDLDIMVSGGRFLNSGDFSDADLTVTGGQAILASDDGRYEVSENKTLAIFDAVAKVGFDGEDGSRAILDLQEGSTVAFKADGDQLGSIEEVNSGAFGDTDVQSGINLGDATLSIDLTGLSSSNGTAFTLMDADEIVGIFDEADIGGLGARNATIVIDYETDSVTLQLTSGNGQVTVETVGEESDADQGEMALWNALTDGQGVASDTLAAVNDLDDEEDDLGFAA